MASCAVDVDTAPVADFTSGVAAPAHRSGMRANKGETSSVVERDFITQRPRVVAVACGALRPQRSAVFILVASSATQKCEALGRSTVIVATQALGFLVSTCQGQACFGFVIKCEVGEQVVPASWNVAKTTIVREGVVGNHDPVCV